jgi:putative transcriptional regulator
MSKRTKSKMAEGLPPPRPMTDDEIEAEYDEDDPPWTEEELAEAKEISIVGSLRIMLRLTQEAFAERYMIPVSTLRSWEQGVTVPDAAGRAYIRAIAGDAEGVARALRRENIRAAE